MADVTIIPPSQVGAVISGGQQSGSATDAANSPSRLSPGSLVSGTIAGKDASGNYLLKTSQGTFALQSSTPLTYNSDVTIRIGSNLAGNTSASIVTVNGEPFSEFSAPAAEAGDSVSATLLSTPIAPEAPAASTATAQATVLSAPPPQPSSGALLSAGNTVVLRFPESATQAAQAQAPTSPDAAPSSTITTSAIVAAQPAETAENTQPAAQQVNPAAISTAPQPSTAPTIAQSTSTIAAPVETELAPAETVTQTGQAQATAQQPTPQTPAPQPQTVAQQASPQGTASPPSAPVSAQYSVYTKQSAAAPSVPAPAAAPAGTPATATTSATQTISIPAQVIGTDENGNLSLQTPQGNVTVSAPSLPAGTALTPGTSVAIELITAAPSQALLSSEPASLTELAASWQSLKDIISTVTTENPSAGASLLANLPQLGPGFASQSTAFMSAVVGGDIRKLLGDDTVDTLEKSERQDLLEKFSGEIANLSTAFNPAVQKQGPSWQTFFLPFVYQEALQQARLYVKRDAPKKERAKEKSTDDTRFIVEVDLSDLGGVQMDGLVRKKDQSTAFDLVIRSHNAFSQEDRAAINSIYTSAAQLTGFKGSLAFHVTRDFPVKPLDEAAGNEDHSITV